MREERKARRREFAKISKDEEKILRAVAKAIREPRGTKEEEKKNSHNIATDNSNASAEGKKIDTNNAAADSDSEDIFADKSYVALSVNRTNKYLNYYYSYEYSYFNSFKAAFYAKTTNFHN